jgi:glycosyltransferase involved in cell wall biosynthesis
MQKTKSDLDVSICLPVYNEKGALRPTVLELIELMDKLPYSYEFIIVDDGSTDDCLSSVRDIKNLRVIRHRRNLGGGVARVTAMRFARGRIILQSDADGSYTVDKIPQMIEQMANADMVVGARRKESAMDFHFLRVFMKTVLRLLASFLSGHSIPDLNSGMRLYDRDLGLRFAYLYPRGHSIMSTITLAFLTEGLRVDFVEIEYRKRIGQSSFRPIRDTYNYFITIIRTIVYFDPLRILMPVVLFFSAIAVFFTLRDLVLFARINNVTSTMWLMSLVTMTLALLSDQFARLSRQIGYLRADFWYDELIREETPEGGKLRVSERQ